MATQPSFYEITARGAYGRGLNSLHAFYLAGIGRIPANLPVDLWLHRPHGPSASVSASSPFITGTFFIRSPPGALFGDVAKEEKIPGMPHKGHFIRASSPDGKEFFCEVPSAFLGMAGLLVCESWQNHSFRQISENAWVASFGKKGFSIIPNPAKHLAPARAHAKFGIAAGSEIEFNDKEARWNFFSDKVLFGFISRVVPSHKDRSDSNRILFSSPFHQTQGLLLERFEKKTVLEAISGQIRGLSSKGQEFIMHLEDLHETVSKFIFPTS